MNVLATPRLSSVGVFVCVWGWMRMNVLATPRLCVHSGCVLWLCGYVILWLCVCVVMCLCDCVSV